MNYIQNEPPIFHKIYEFIIWIYPTINKFPKSQRFVLGQRMENVVLDILELLIEAKLSKIRISFLQKSSVKLDKLRILMRLTKDLKFISVKEYEFGCKQIDEIGRMLGGWIKSLS
jgi:four helix bundle protein